MDEAHLNINTSNFQFNSLNLKWSTYVNDALYTAFDIHFDMFEI